MVELRAVDVAWFLIATLAGSAVGLWLVSALP
jgi:hypothetical protein